MRSWWLVVFLIPGVHACDWIGPEGIAVIDMTDWTYEAHQVQGMMADGSCSLETPFDLAGTLVWIDDGYDRSQVGIWTNDIDIVAAPGRVLDVATFDDDVFAAIELGGLVDGAPERLALMRHETGAWVEHDVQPPLDWTGGLDGRLAIHRDRSTGDLWSYDFVQSAYEMAPRDGPGLDDGEWYLGFDEGAFWFWAQGGFLRIAADGDAAIQVPHEDVYSWAADGPMVWWSASVDGKRSLWNAAPDQAPQVAAVWGAGVYLGDLAAVEGDRLVIAALGINEWKGNWRAPEQGDPIIPEVPPLDNPVPAPLGLSVLVLLALLRKA